MVGLLALSAGSAIAGSLDSKEADELRQARQLYKSGNYQAAADIFSRLSAAHPELPTFARNAGAAYYYLKKPDPALSNLREYLRVQKKLDADDREEVEKWIAEMEQLRAQASPGAPAPPAQPVRQPPSPTPGSPSGGGVAGQAGPGYAPGYVYPPPGTPTAPAGTPPSQPYPQQRQPYPQAGQTYPQPNQPYPPQVYPQGGRPSPQPGQPYPQAGQPSSQPGQPYPQPGQPYPQAGQQSNQPYPQAGQPSPQSNQPYPQAGQPSPQSNQPYPQAGQPYPQGAPSPQGGQPYPQAGQPYPPSGQLEAQATTAQNPQDAQPSLSAPPQEAPAAPNPAFSAAPAAEVQGAQTAETGSGVLPWIIGGAGVAAIGVGGLFTYLYRSAYSDTQAQYNPDRESEGRTYSYLQFVGYGLGAACVTTAVILLVRGGDRGNAQVSITPALGPQLAGAELSIRY
jgi:hypothetical protein